VETRQHETVSAMDTKKLDAYIRDLNNRVALECPAVSNNHNDYGFKTPENQNVLPTTSRQFSDLPISRKTLGGLNECEYKLMTPIQLASIPHGLAGRDILGESRTGSGKTLAQIVPLLENLFRKKWSKSDGLGAIMLSPTRELATQTFNILKRVGIKHDFSAGCIVGGRNFIQEKKMLGMINIVVCTPGRLLQHLEQNSSFDASSLQILIIDEADRILDMGFRETVTAIVEYLPSERQTLLFSATLRQSVNSLASLALKDPEIITISRESLIPPKLKTLCMTIDLERKFDSLFCFLQNHSRSKTIVFVNSTKEVRFISEVFRRLKAGPTILDLQGKQSIEKRLNIFDEFQRRDNSVCLICTDVASRGVDFPKVDWVVQMDAPEDVDSYIHRIGRTARFDSTGSALIFLMPEEKDPFIDQLNSREIPLPTTVHPNESKIVSLQGRLMSILAKDAEIKNVAIKAYTSYLRSLVLTGRVSDISESKRELFAQSLGLSQAPDLELFAPKRRKQSSLQILKQKIADHKSKRSDWIEAMQMDAELQPKKKSKRSAELIEESTFSDPVTDDGLFITETVYDASVKIPTSAELKASDALKVKKTRINKYGTMHIRGSGNLGKPREPVIFNDSDQQDASTINKDLFLQEARQRLALSSAQDTEREKQRIRDKHAKIKRKLRGEIRNVDQYEEKEFSCSNEIEIGIDDLTNLEIQYGAKTS
jgi:ATP-dependent RNA helicase DDX10/DBP4